MYNLVTSFSFSSHLYIITNKLLKPNEVNEWKIKELIMGILGDKIIYYKQFTRVLMKS